MLDFFGTILLTAALTVVIAAIVGSLAGGLPARLGFAAFAGVWIGLILAVFANDPKAGLLIPVLFVGVLVLIGMLLVFSRGARSALAGIPVELIIGVNALRTLGFLFLLLAAAGRLSGPFPYSAGIGDIVTGVFAIPVALTAARGGLNTTRVVLWNWFGLLDLVAAVALGTISGNGTPLQLIHAGVGSAAIASLPWTIIPLVLVPLFIVGHLAVFARMRSDAIETQRRPAVAL